MTVASVATNQCKKAVKMGISLFRRGFNSSKCKTTAKMAVARMKLLRNKREVVVRQMRRDIAMLLESGQDATARIRVEHVIREQNIMAANEILELFCELIVARLTIITKQRACPADLKEGISSLIFAGPRCSDIPELLGLRDVFEKKYGKDFVSTATDLRPDAGVNRMLIEKLSVRTPSGEVKLKVLKEIAKEYQVEWDTTESEMELLKPPEELIDGPSTFVSASTLPVKSNQKQSVDPQIKPTSRCSDNVESNLVHFNDTASAAEAAAESAKRAIAAAEVAAYLASKDTQPSRFDNMGSGMAVNGTHAGYGNPPRESVPKGLIRSAGSMGNEYDEYDKAYPPSDEALPTHAGHGNPLRKSVPKGLTRSVGSMGSEYDEYDNAYPPSDEPLPTHAGCGNPLRKSASKGLTHSVGSMGNEYDNTYPPSDEALLTYVETRKINRRHSYNIPPAHSDIKFDESDYDEEMEMEEPPSHKGRPHNGSDYTDARKVNRRHSYNVSSANQNVKLDESDNEEDDTEMEETIIRRRRMTHQPPPNRPAPQVPPTYVKQNSVPCVHPKLPDYDVLAARFEALKYHKSQT